MHVFSNDSHIYSILYVNLAVEIQTPAILKNKQTKKTTLSGLSLAWMMCVYVYVPVKKENMWTKFPAIYNFYSYYKFEFLNKDLLY